MPSSALRALALVPLLGLCFLSGPAPALAASTGTLSLSATVAKVCTVSSATLNFSSYNALAAANASTGAAAFTVTCSVGTPAQSFVLGASPNATSCSSGSYCLKNGSSYLNYALFSDSGDSTPFPASVTVPLSTGIAAPQTVTIYGAIGSGQDVATGTYTDSVQVTLNY